MADRKRAHLGLFAAALLFGVTFVVIKDAAVTLPPLAFVGWRFLLGAGVLFILARPHGRSIWVDGLVAGSPLFAGFSTQTLGLAETSASAATAAVVLGERLTARGWLWAALIMAGVCVVLAFAPPEEADSIVANPSTGVH